MKKQPDFTKLDNLLNSIPKDRTPGINMSVYYDGNIVFRKTYGTYDEKYEKDTLPDTAYTLFSMTKVFTSGCAMQLVERGIFSLEDNISKYIPAFEHMKVRNADGSLCDAKNSIKIKHLLAMQGGFDYDLYIPEIKEVIEKTKGHATTRQVIEALAKKPLNFEPGTHFQYSLCHDVLLAVIESATGMDYEDYIRKNIWEPLGITHAAMRLSSYPEKDKMAVIFKNTPEDPTLVSGGINNWFVPTDNYESGGAGLIATCDDYMKYAATLANGGISPFTGKRILKKETIDLWHTDMQTSPECYADFQNCIAKYGYGLGVRTNITEGNGSSPVGEFGWDGAAGSYVMMDTDYNVAAVYMQSVCNSAYDCRPTHFAIRDAVFDAIYEANR